MYHRLALLLVFLSIPFSLAVEEEEGVLVLTKDNFHDVIKENANILVEFYAPWCGHCKALAPEYAKAAKELADQKFDVRLGKLDATEHGDIASEFSVNGYPTLIFFRDGKQVPYNGGRDSSAIVSWLKKKTGPPAVEVNSAEELEKIQKDVDVVVSAYFEGKDSIAEKIFTTVAVDYDSIEFTVSHADEIKKALDLEGSGLVIHRKGEGVVAKFDGESTVENVKNWIRSFRMPLVSEFTQETASKIFGSDIKTHHLLFLSRKSPLYEKLYSAFKTAADEFKGLMQFVFLDTDNAENSRILEFFGIKNTEVPTTRIIQLGQEIMKYKPNFSDINADTLKEFAKSFFDGKLSLDLKSEEIPEDWDKNPVKVVVAKNFEDVVLDKSKNVFIEFYAPWCGHCKQLAPIWDKLGEEFASNGDVVIAKMDATANEVADLSIQSFPTIKLYLAESNKVVDYSGERTLEGFTNFLNKQTSDSDDKAEDSEDKSEHSEL
ncbi:unnamed protein product [Caenorhabditis auriculariae]|uniref:Protein disulfide-isomerase n=1 Tax=Caenorhabditis auriculariae TaxID=2777116 RepID=A0A8S1GVY8_9PELO|nr:unnamed protein product [Caenorhabditis auriculariae]